jgi:hypothetical protein
LFVIAGLNGVTFLVEAQERPNSKASPMPLPIATPDQLKKLQQWEYITQSAPNGEDNLVPFLNKLGAEGWELAAVNPSGLHRYPMIFKRPK